MNEKITLEGKKYTRIKGKWVNSDYMVMHEILQDKLNKLYYDSIDLSTLELREIISEGDAFKSTASYGLAIKYYEYAIEQADQTTIDYILPRITSCYRKQGRAKDVIELIPKMKRKYGEKILTHTLLTSIAAAYCDLEQYDNARKCCDRARTKLVGEVTEELSLVYKRIDTNTK